jgi:TatD DNase family protein
VIDSHCHLDLCEPATEELVAAAREAGVDRMLTVGVDAAASREAIAAAERFEEVFACVGRHPNGASGFDDADASEIEELARHPRVAAVGETGLDFYRDRATPGDQHRAFRAQIEIARRVAKPLVIHLRDSGRTTDGAALEEAYGTLAAEATGVTVILHCFSAPAYRALEAAERGWYCSFAGNATYPSADDLREAARAVPDRLLLVETDAPFLSPQPARGKPNQPANVVETARLLAADRGCSYEELERLVEANAARAFGW